MGTLYKTACNSCLEEYELSWGDGMFNLQFQCKNCLRLFNIPRNAPRPNRNGRVVPKFLETHDFKSLAPIPNAEITRFTNESLKAYFDTRSQWQHGDDLWDAYEIELLISFIACECNADIRHVNQQENPTASCRKCGSINLRMAGVGISD